jgi:hypothetical protein
MDANKQALPRAKVLILIHSDKFIEAYSSDQNIDVHFHHTPETSTNSKAEILAEELIERSLPTFWSRIYSQGQRIGQFPIRPKTISQEIDRRILVAFCREIDKVSKDGKDAPS